MPVAFQVIAIRCYRVRAHLLFILLARRCWNYVPSFKSKDHLEGSNVYIAFLPAQLVTWAEKQQQSNVTEIKPRSETRRRDKSTLNCWENSETFGSCWCVSKSGECCQARHKIGTLTFISTGRETFPKHRSESFRDFTAMTSNTLLSGSHWSYLGRRVYWSRI